MTKSDREFIAECAKLIIGTIISMSLMTEEAKTNGIRRTNEIVDGNCKLANLKAMSRVDITRN